MLDTKKTKIQLIEENKELKFKLEQIIKQYNAVIQQNRELQMKVREND